MATIRRIARALAPGAGFAAAVLAGLAVAPDPVASRGPEPDAARRALVTQLTAAAPTLSADALTAALEAWRNAVERGLTTRPVLTVIDYSLPSTDKRLWVLDLSRGAVLFHELVAHGMGSGDREATRFSNRHGSNQTSLGTFLTGNTYLGRNGLSLRLRGLEPGVNDQAEARAIVVHGADYVSEQFIATTGRLGRSHGCPAVRRDVLDEMLGTIGTRTVVFSFHRAAT